MTEIDKLVSQVLLAVKSIGLTNISPCVLHNGRNLIIHLSPYPIVARIATVLSQEDTKHAYKILDRELHAARHLHAKGVPVLMPTGLVEAGPYDVNGKWMTLWDYVPPTQLQAPSPIEAVAWVRDLSLALNDFGDELPVLGVWERTSQSAARLKKQSDPRIQSLLKMFLTVDEQMRLETQILT